MTDIRHFLDIADIPTKDLRAMLDRARELKADRRQGKPSLPHLQGKTLAMIFEKPSTRTRISFDVAMTELGGHALTLQKNDLQLGRGETVADTAKVISRYAHAIMLRANYHSTLEELAGYADVPVINGLTDLHHPCQIMADLMTVEERLNTLEGKVVAWVGDGNNVCHSWMAAVPHFGFTLRVAAPQGFEPDVEIEHKHIHHVATPAEAVAGADVVITDTWVSMGDDDTLARRKSFAPYQVNSALMSKAANHAIFLHCLPAHRGEEVTDEVLDGAQSAVFDEAENRLHTQKAVLLWCLNRLDWE